MAHHTHHSLKVRDLIYSMQIHMIAFLLPPDRLAIIRVLMGDGLPIAYDSLVFTLSVPTYYITSTDKIITAGRSRLGQHVVWKIFPKRKTPREKWEFYLLSFIVFSLKLSKTGLDSQPLVSLSGLGCLLQGQM